MTINLIINLSKFSNQSFLLWEVSDIQMFFGLPNGFIYYSYDFNLSILLLVFGPELNKDFSLTYLAYVYSYKSIGDS